MFYDPVWLSITWLMPKQQSCEIKEIKKFPHCWFPQKEMWLTVGFSLKKHLTDKKLNL